MEKMRLQTPNGSVCNVSFVYRRIAETRLPTTEQPQDRIRPPTAMADELAAETGQARNLVSGAGARIGDHGLDLGGQSRCHALVGIQREHPFPLCKIQGAVLLRPEAGPIVRNVYLRPGR